MLKAEKRHTAQCVAYRRHLDPSAAEYDEHARCRCSYRAIGMLGGQFIRKSLKTSNYEKAARTINQWESEGKPEKPADHAVAIREAVTAYLEDAKARNLREATLAKLTTIFEKQLLGFCESKGYKFLRQLADVNVVREFRAGWKDAPLARSKKQDRVIGFFYFCHRSGWLPVNPITSRALGRIKVEEKPTDYFTPDEFNRILP
jgi:integrase/recombinase XerD